MRSRDVSRRDLFIDLALKTAKVGGLAVLLQNTPVYQLAKMLGVKAEHMPFVIRDMGLQEAEAATLPLNYVVTAGTVVDGADCRNGVSIMTTNAVLSGNGAAGAGNIATDNVDTTYIKNGGTKNVRLDMLSGTITQAHDLRMTLNSIVMDQQPTVSMRFYGDTFTLNDVYWGNDAPFANSFKMSRPGFPSASVALGWQWLHWHRDHSTVVAAGNWQTDFLRLGVFPTVAATAQTRFGFYDQFFYGGYQHPVIPVIFEGGHDNHYDVIFPAWTWQGLRGTLAIPTSLIDSDASLYLTTAEIDEMYEAGWDVIHMSDTTTALSGLTVQQVVDRLGTADTFMASKGWTRTAKYVALPGTLVTTHRADANMITALTQLGYKGAIDKWSDGATSAAVTSPAGFDPEYGFSLNPYRIPAWRAENPDTITEHTNHLNYAIAAGSQRIFRIGDIATGAAAGQIETADHTTLLNTLSLKHHAGTISCVPWRKFVSGLSGRMVRA